jgi:integrase/recombinase XerD
MAGKQAKTLSTADLHDLLLYASCTRQPLRNAVLVLLSAKAGLRAGEIASLTWDMVLDANGQITGLIELRDHAAKKCSGRSIPLHADLAAALAAWRAVAPPCDHVIASERRGAMSPLSTVVWFNRAFKNIGPATLLMESRPAPSFGRQPHDLSAVRGRQRRILGVQRLRPL